MRKLYKILICCATLILPYTCMADKFMVDGINYSSDDGKTASVISRTERYYGDVIIPSKVTYNSISYVVSSISDQAFYGCTGLASVEIPNSITSIGKNAFENCSKLNSIEIPSSVTSIGGALFADCTSITSIIVNNNNEIYDSRNNCNAIIETASNTLISGCKSTKIPSGVVSIGEKAFHRCEGLNSIEIPNSITSIGKLAFGGCTGLTSIEIPNSVKFVGDMAFTTCTGLTSIEIPNSITSIGEYAFSTCTGLTSIEIPSSITSVGKRAFYRCTKLTSINWNAENCQSMASDVFLECLIEKFVFGESVKIIPTYCCYKMNGLTSIEIPNGVTSIGDYAFTNCTGLTSIKIPNSVTSIGLYAFNNCTGLSSIKTPNSVTSIGRYAFNSCTGLTSIEISNGITSIEEGAFSGCTGLTSIKIPNSVTSIGHYSFSGCTGLTSIEISNGITSIKEGAFSGCTGLTSVKIPNSVTSIGYNAFSGCTGLTSVYWNAENCQDMGSAAFKECPIEKFTFGKSVKIIPTICCYGMNRLKSVEIPNGVTSIGNSAFAYCTGLTSIEIANSVTSIGYRAFEGCTGLTSIEIPNSVTSIEYRAFSGCTGLTSVYWDAENCQSTSVTETIFKDCSIERFTFGESVKIIPSRCCYGMNSLKSVVIPNGVTSIGGGAFYGCTGLTSIEIPKSVTSIVIPFGGCTGLKSVYWNAENCQFEYSYTFKDCPIEKFTFGESVKVIPNDCCREMNRLTSIEIPNSVTSIGNSAFYACTGLTSVEIPNGVTSIGYSAFSGCSGLTSINWDAEYCQSIGYDVFNGCPIEKFTFGESVKVIPNNCCNGMNLLTLIKIPDSVTSIGDYAIYYCTGLISIEIPGSVTSIGSGAFSGCAGLTSIIVDQNNKKYDSRDNCSAIIETKTNKLIVGCKNTNIPNGVASIGFLSFYNCTGLTSIEIPNSVTSIGDHAFTNCTGLTSIKIPNGVTSINSETFSGCTELTLVEIPNSVTSIEYGAFSRCTSLTSIEIPNSVTSIGSNAFYACTGLTSVEIPNGVTSIGYSAFSGCTGISKIWCFSNIPPEANSYTFSDIDKSIPIYVPCGSIEDYQNAGGWSEFTNYNCISADPVEEEIDEPTVTPEKTSVVIAWPVDESAETYTINITKGGVTVCTITFDANGNVITIDYPSNGSTKGAELRGANVLPNGYSYEITGLEEGTEYSYIVTAQNGSGVTVDEYSGTFRTQGGAVSVEENNSNRSFSLQNAVIVNDNSISVNGVEPSDVSIYNTAGKQVSNPVPAAGVYVVKVGDEAVKVMVK